MTVGDQEWQESSDGEKGGSMTIKLFWSRLYEIYKKRKIVDFPIDGITDRL